VDVLIQEKEEIPNKEDGGHENSNDTNGNSTTLDWETSAA
jgi:hypothetical protein